MTHLFNYHNQSLIEILACLKKMFWKVNTATESWEIGKNLKDGILAGASTVGGRTGCDPPEAEVAAVREQEHWALGKEQTASGTNQIWNQRQDRYPDY